MKKLLEHAREEKYAVGSFDVANLETATAVIEVAQENDSPVIIAIPESFFKLQHFEAFVSAIRTMAEPIDIPVALILDHGKSFEGCVRAINAGMTSIMFDGSELPFNDNIAMTKKVVEIAKVLGITVEGEVGHVGGSEFSNEEISALETDPKKAEIFVRETGVDCLAVAIGTKHGNYQGKPNLRFDLLEQIEALTNIPLVLHGGSSTGEENLQKAISMGICKINIYTDMSNRAKENIQYILSGDSSKLRINDIIIAAKEGFREIASHYMKCFGSVGKAKMISSAKNVLRVQ